MTCATCKHWDHVPGRIGKAQSDERGRCMAALPVPAGLVSNAHSDFREAVWPETLPTDGKGCAHYVRDALTRQEAAEHVQAIRRAQAPHETLVCGRLTTRPGVEL